MSFHIQIEGLKYGDDMPKEFTCEGNDISPGIKWSDPPASTKSYILILEDPDAPRGNFVHWVAYNIPHATTEIPKNVDKVEKTTLGFTQGKNDFGKVGYGGPCPPGKIKHHYVLTLYATLHTEELPPMLTKKDLQKIIAEKTVKQASTMLTFGKTA
ncbi:MAG: YbhB/YbcL family Raf kinase inhibitor-like protein [Thermoplasmataceae archaeon]